jgi:hypothetical protein
MASDSINRLRAKLGAHALHAKYDSRETSQPARDAFMAKFEREADPDGTLDPAERKRRARHLLQAHMVRLAMRSALARRKRAS